MGIPKELATSAISKLKLTSVLAVASDLVTVVPTCVAAAAHCSNFFDMGAMMTLLPTMFNWCGTALRVLCIRFKYW